MNSSNRANTTRKMSKKKIKWELIDEKVPDGLSGTSSFIIHLIVLYRIMGRVNLLENIIPGFNGCSHK